ncbi:MAG: exodeoxyribonuclease VII small subunit [Planctomycetota bacterium]
MAKKRKTQKDDVSFETSLDQLKQIIAELETGNLSLSDSLEKYEQGIASLKNCHVELAKTQKKIELLVDLDENGNLITRPFDDSATDSQSTGVRREAVVETDSEESDSRDIEDVDDQLDEEFGGLF